MNGRLAVLVVLIAAAGVVHSFTRVVAVSNAQSLADIPMTVETWTGHRAASYAPNVVETLGVDQYINRTYYSVDDRVANLYVGYYRSQSQGASIHSPLNCMPGAGWEMVDVERVPFAGGTARRVLIRKGAERLMVLYWYQSAMRVEGDEIRGRLYMAFDTMRYGRNDAALVRVTVPVADTPGAETRAIEAVTDLASGLAPHISRVLFPPITDVDRSAVAATPAAGERERTRPAS